MDPYIPSPFEKGGKTAGLHGKGGDRSELTAHLDVPCRSLQRVVVDGYARERTEADSDLEN